jgi:hypothetical protein
MHLCLRGAPVRVQLRAVAGGKRDIEAGVDAGDWREGLNLIRYRY